MSRDTTEAKREKRHGPVSWQPSILIYLLVMNFILLCLLFPTLAIYLLHHETSFQKSHLERTLAQLRHTLELRGSSLAHSLALSAGQAIAGFNFSFLNSMVNDVVNENKEIVYCFIMDPNRKILAHNDPKQIGLVLEDKNSFLVADMENKIFLARLTAAARPKMVRFIEDKLRKGNESLNILEVVTPVYSGANLAGFLRCGYSLAELDRDMEAVKQDWGKKIKQLKNSFIFISVLFFLIGGVVALIFTRTFVRSIRVLDAGVVKITRGDLKHRIRMDGLVCTEFTRLSDSFNTMTEKLRLSYEQLEQYSRNLEQKVEERTKDLKLAQASLLRQAHEAGMAEMAVGILHNIGNAITPAKVNTALLIKMINESRIRKHIKEMMARLGKVLNDPADSIPEEIEKARQIVSVLPEAILEEYDHINNEIVRIRDKHEHIESIIHLQLRYARLSGNIENVNINKVVLDSLEMLKDSIRKYAIIITKDLADDLPLVRIEQSRLLQVIINIVKNAVEAMSGTDPGKRHIVVTTCFNRGEKAIAISIKDSGTGFAPETREKLFTYGYSTKKTGSGFGLHSCANFLIAHKGSIEAKSDGDGKGAEFIINLPVSQEENPEVV